MACADHLAGLCGPASADAVFARLTPHLFGDVGICHSAVSCLCELRAGVADATASARTGRRQMCAGAGGAVFGVRRCVPHSETSAHRECVRAAARDELCVCGDPGYHDRQSEAMAMLWRAGGDRAGEQILDGGVRLRRRGGVAAHTRAQGVSKPWICTAGAIAFLIFLPNCSGMCSIIFRFWS